MIIFINSVSGIYNYGFPILNSPYQEYRKTTIKNNSELKPVTFIDKIHYPRDCTKRTIDILA